MKDYSQNGESKVLERLLNLIGIANPKCLELGARDGYDLSNTRYFKDKGCHVDMYDGNTRGGKDVKELFLTVENVKDILTQQYNLLSIDIDGNDYWILTELLKHQKPDVICFEVNSQVPLDECKTIAYNPSFKHDGTIYLGMSYLAGVKICKDYGYTIYKIVGDSNIIAARNEHNVKPDNPTINKTPSFPFKDGQWVNL